MRLPLPVHEESGEGTGPIMESGTVTPMPEGLDPQFWDSTDSKVRTDDLIKSHNELMQFRSSRDEVERALAESIPKDPSDYPLDLPADMEIPAGLEIKYDDKDPIVLAAREMAKEIGLPKEAFTKLLALDAQRILAEYNANLEADSAEQEALGENGSQRVEAVENYMKANLDEAQYEALRPVVHTAKALEAVEKLISKATSSAIPADPGGDNNPKPEPVIRLADQLYGPQDKAG